MAAWVPEQDGLRQILTTIRQSMDVNLQVQREITSRLAQFTQYPEYAAYLAYILSAMTEEEERIRSIAGYLLKNNARLILLTSTEVMAYVKVAVLTALTDESAMVRNATAQGIVALLGVLQPRNWPECLVTLVSFLDHPVPGTQEAAFCALERACEDFPRELDINVSGERPLDYMIPKLLSLTDHPLAKMRSHAIACISSFVVIRCQSLHAHVDFFIGRLCSHASDDDPAVRRHVCQAFAFLLAALPRKLMPEISNVSQYMLQATKDQDQDVALEACEFWLTFAEDGSLSVHLQPFLGSVASALLDCMVYNEDDLPWLQGDAEGCDVPDEESNIKPRFYGDQIHDYEHGGNERCGGGDESKRTSARVEQTPTEDSDADDLDDDFAEEKWTEWNLRKCAAAALDVLAVRFGAELLCVIIGPLKARLESDDWLQRESAILALGAVAGGCMEAIELHLPKLVPYLIGMLEDSKPLVRAIACWALQRYIRWVVRPILPEHKIQYFVPTMNGLLRMVLDNNKRVQEAGCSAIASLEDDAGILLVPYLEHIIRSLVCALDKYQRKNMLVLYDTIGTLAGAVGPALQGPAHVDILMPPLLDRWSRVRDDDEDLIPLLECFESVAIAVGSGLLPYAPLMIERCSGIIRRSLLQYQAYQQRPDQEEPEHGFLVVTFNLLSGLTRGLSVLIQPFMSASLLELTTICLKHPSASVRQSACTLIGVAAKHCWAVLQSHIPNIMPELIPQLDPETRSESVGAASRAAWSLGEIVLQNGLDEYLLANISAPSSDIIAQGPASTQWVRPLTQRLVLVLLHPRTPLSLRENAAVLAGRLGLTHPNMLAPHLDKFAQAWCQALHDIQDSEEKDSAFRGLCAVVQANRAGVSGCLLCLCSAIVQWKQPSAELHSMFHFLLQSFKAQDEATWKSLVASFPKDIQDRLSVRYGV